MNDPIRESALYAPGRNAPLLTVITVPVSPKSGAPAVVFLNAGLVHRVGPNRLYVRLARALARQGYPCVRFDLSGFGDSAAGSGALGSAQAAVADTRDILSHLESKLGMGGAVLFGICSGADTALRTAAEDPRVRGVIMVDAFAFSTWLFRARSYGRRLFQAESWKGLFAGRSGLARALLARARGGGGPAGGDDPADAPIWENPPPSVVVERMRALLSRGGRALLAYSGASPAWCHYLLHHRKPFRDLGRRHPLEVRYFREAFHTFTFRYHQDQLGEAVAAWLEAGFPPSPPG